MIVFFFPVTTYWNESRKSGTIHQAIFAETETGLRGFILNPFPSGFDWQRRG